MKLIIPMAGMGKRLRPHTLLTPKPLFSIAGTTIVERLVFDIAKNIDEPVEEITYIIGNETFFGKEVTDNLAQISKKLNAKCFIFRQVYPLGTGHAIMCAEKTNSGPTIIAYADTLIRFDFHLDKKCDSIIWAKEVPNPEQYGVVVLNERQEITKLVEKSNTKVSNLAVVGIYYFKDIGILKKELQNVIDNDIKHGGEYQINDGIKRMMEKNYIFKPGKVKQWMDCGNKEMILQTHKNILKELEDQKETQLHPSVEIENSKIISPCYIGKNVQIKHSTIGPFVTVGEGALIENTTLKDTIIHTQSKITNTKIQNSIIGNHVVFNGAFNSIDVGDYSTIN